MIWTMNEAKLDQEFFIFPNGRRSGENVEMNQEFWYNTNLSFFLRKAKLESPNTFETFIFKIMMKFCSKTYLYLKNMLPDFKQSIAGKFGRCRYKRNKKIVSIRTMRTNINTFVQRWYNLFSSSVDREMVLWCFRGPMTENRENFLK